MSDAGCPMSEAPEALATSHMQEAEHDCAFPECLEEPRSEPRHRDLRLLILLRQPHLHQLW
jgi:hypothetical protein